MIMPLTALGSRQTAVSSVEYSKSSCRYNATKKNRGGKDRNPSERIIRSLSTLVQLFNIFRCSTDRLKTDVDVPVKSSCRARRALA